jgi:hypothetical protein
VCNHNKRIKLQKNPHNFKSCGKEFFFADKLPMGETASECGQKERKNNPMTIIIE